MAEYDLVGNNPAKGNTRVLPSGATLKALTRSVFNRYTNATTTTTSQESLWSNTIAAGTFVTDGGELTIIYTGIFASNTRSKAFEITFGATSIFNSDDIDTITTNGGGGFGWKILVNIMRASNTEVRYTTELVARGLTDTDPWMKTGEITSLNLTTTGYNIVLKATTSGGSGDVTAKTAKCLYHPGV